MAHYDLEEQEQLDTLKTWWKMHGNFVTGVVMAAAIAVVGWQGWNWQKNGQASQASAVYGVLEQALAANDNQRIKAAAGELVEKFGGTAYASLGAMMAGRHSFESGDLKTAHMQFAWVVENGKDEMKDLARLRLAAVQIDEKEYDEALKQLGAEHASAFDSRFLEAKGDVLVAQGKAGDARAAYQAAIEKLGEQGGSAREIIQQKLDSLGGAA